LEQLLGINRCGQTGDVAEQRTGGSEMGTKRVGKPAKKPVSSKAQADPAAEKKYRGEARADRTAEAAD
jgi:hypothetical protein